MSPIFFSGSASFQRTAQSPLGVISVVASFLLTMTLLISGRGGWGNQTDGLAAGTSGCSNHKACPPVADAGPDRTVEVGDNITLNGSGSHSTSTGLMTYQWTLESKPSTSAATLAGATTANPIFKADVGGSYIFALVVNNGGLFSNTDVVIITANIRDGMDIQRPAATAIGAQATTSTEEGASATEQMKFDDVQREARQKWYAEMREAPEVTLRLHALDVWAEHPNDGIDPLTHALVDADESVRTRAQELYSRYLLGEEATAQSTQQDPVASDAQEPYTEPMPGEEAADQFIQEDPVASDAQGPYTQPMLGEEATAQFIQEDPVASDAQELYTQPMRGEEAAAQFIQEDSVVSEADVEGMRDTSTTGSRESNDDSKL